MKPSMNGSKQKDRKGAAHTVLHRISAADAEAYEVKVAQHYAAVQMETQNFTAPENWITEDNRAYNG